MRLFVLRHGQAEPFQQSDFHRALTIHGRDEVTRRISTHLTDLQGSHEIWVSPYIRAQQTAIIASALLVNNKLKTKDFLIPESDPYTLIDELYASQLESVLLVSHQPLVSRIINILCGENCFSPQMNTASLACIDLDVIAVGLGRLCWVRSV